MLFIISILGLVGAVILGIVGLARGDAGELERILAIAFVAMAAAGFVGRSSRTPRSTATLVPRRGALTFGDVVMGIVSAPIIALMIGVFLLTLIPSAYVMLPVFALWWLGGGARHPRETEPSAAPAPMPEPAMA